MRNLGARAMRILRRRVQRVTVLSRIIIADRGARLHRHRRQPVVLDTQLHVVLRLRERRIGRRLVADHQLKRDVAVRIVVPHFRRPILGGVFEQRHRRQRLVVDLDHFGRIAGLRERFGDNKGNTVTHEARFVGLQQLLMNAVTFRCAEILRHHGGREPAEVIMRDVGASQHQ